jgi:hypothetical protein
VCVGSGQSPLARLRRLMRHALGSRCRLGQSLIMELPENRPRDLWNAHTFFGSVILGASLGIVTIVFRKMASQSLEHEPEDSDPRKRNFAAAGILSVHLILSKAVPLRIKQLLSIFLGGT